MKQAFLLALLLLAVPASAGERTYLMPEAVAARIAMAELLVTCPPHDDETSLVWKLRCVPREIVLAGEELRIIDGDTLAVDDETMRLIDIDAPELHGANCIAEQMLAMLARDQLGLVPVTAFVERFGPDKYGRTLVRITTEDGTDWGELLIAMGLAVPYDGGQRIDWCR